MLLTFRNAYLCVTLSIHAKNKQTITRAQGTVNWSHTILGCDELTGTVAPDSVSVNWRAPAAGETQDALLKFPAFMLGILAA